MRWYHFDSTTHTVANIWRDQRPMIVMNVRARQVGALGGGAWSVALSHVHHAQRARIDM